MVQSWEHGFGGPVLDYFLGELCHQFSLWMPDLCFNALLERTCVMLEVGYLQNFERLDRSATNNPGQNWRFSVCACLFLHPGSCFQGHVCLENKLLRKIPTYVHWTANHSVVLMNFLVNTLLVSCTIYQSLLPHGWTRKTSSNPLTNGTGIDRSYQ